MGSGAFLLMNSIKGLTSVLSHKNNQVRIPITMCHGVSERLSVDRFNEYFKIASSLGFSSISYNDLETYFANKKNLPKKPIVFDFDHPVRSIYTEIFPIMKRYGFKGNLFVNTEPLEKMYSYASTIPSDRIYMTWEEIKELINDGWSIGSHTHTHPNLSELAAKDPSGELIRWELEKNDSILEKELSIKPKYFAFTGTSWSSLAEQEVMNRYKFGRLWIIGSHYQADGKSVRYADLVNEAGSDEIDGGPPFSARYITTKTPHYKIPSMELEGLIYEYDAFRLYLESA
jgi:peptidoglycan/xylan/chitin deacetylase (PgdA/CDA1 family)